MALASLTEYLDDQNIKYVIISHSLAYTAQGIAGLVHIPGRELAKTVMVKLDGDLVMTVLPAVFHVDLMLLKKTINARSVALAMEEEFKDKFPQCETGAMPPFGNLYGFDVFVDDSLTKDKDIAFNAGSHRELIRMSFADYERLVRPKILRFAARRTAEVA